MFRTPTRRWTYDVAAAAVMLMLAGAAAPVLAEAPSMPHSAIHKAAVSATSDTAPTNIELDEFAEAVIATGNIKRAARRSIVGATSATERTRLEHQATRAIKSAIRRHHLSLQRYLQIVAFINAHPATQRQFVALMKALPMPPPPGYQR